MENTMTNNWSATPTCLGTSGYICAASAITKDRAAFDDFGSVEGITAGFSAWRPLVC